MKALFIASIVLLAVFVNSQAPVTTEPGKLRGLDVVAKPPTRQLGLLDGVGGLVGDLLNTVTQLLNSLLNLNPTLNNLLSVLDNLDLGNLLNLGNLAKVRAGVNALGLLRVKLLLKLSGNTMEHCAAANTINLDSAVADLLDLILHANLNNEVSVCLALNALDILGVKLNLILLRRNLGLLDPILGLVGSLINTLSNLVPTVEQLLGVLDLLDLNDLGKVRASINALGLLRVKLLVKLDGNTMGNCAASTVNLDTAVADLLNTILNVNLDDNVSVCLALNALDILGVKLNLILLRRDLGLLDPVLGIVGQLLNTLGGLTYTVDNLLGVLNLLDLSNLVKVRACVNALGLLRVKLLLKLTGYTTASCPSNGTINLDTAVADLLNLILNVNLDDQVSVCLAVQALDFLGVKLNLLLL